MKNSKLRRILMLLACAVLLVCLSVGATLAYLTSITSEVQNTFTVGHVAITLDEAPTNTDGEVIEGDRRLTNDYHLLPGHEYAKDPTVHVGPNSEDCYVFIKFYNAIESIEAEENTIADQMATKGWFLVDGETDIYYYGTEDAPVKVSKNANLVIFEKFTIDGTLQADDIADFATEKDADGNVLETAEKLITITAYAIQADGFEADAAVIWAAFDTQHPGA